MAALVPDCKRKHQTSHPVAFLPIADFWEVVPLPQRLAGQHPCRGRIALPARGRPVLAVLQAALAEADSAEVVSGDAAAVDFAAPVADAGLVVLAGLGASSAIEGM